MVDKPAVWVDQTSHAQGAPRETRTVVLYIEGCRIAVTRHIDYPPDAWVLSTELGGIGRVELKAKDFAAAKNEAIHHVLDELSRITTALNTRLRLDSLQEELP